MAKRERRRLIIYCHSFSFVGCCERNWSTVNSFLVNLAYKLAIFLRRRLSSSHMGVAGEGQGSS